MLSCLSACGGKHVPVSVPRSASPSSSASELEGLASYYAEPYHGRRTANGEVFDTYQAMTAAHRTLPFNTVVRVQNKSNGKEVEVRINDRGPFIAGRVIDLSLRAARAIDLVRAGVVAVKLTIIRQGPGARRTASDAPFDTIQGSTVDNLHAADDRQRP
jgi:rare lipoprotein A